MTIPAYHPLLVHFPIAFLLGAALGALAWAAVGGDFWRRVVLVMLVLGTAGGVAALRTGETMEEIAEGPNVEALVHDHEEAGERAVYLGGVALVALAALEIARRRRPEWTPAWWARALVAAAVIGAAGFVLRAGQLGGLMVWGTGA